jgi:hypothetical protein
LFDVVIENEPSVVIERMKVVVFGEHDPALPRRVFGDFLVGSVVRKDVLGLHQGEPVGRLEGVDILLKHASITEKPRTEES